MDAPVRTAPEVENLLRLTKSASADQIIDVLKKNTALLNAEEGSGRTILHFCAYLGRAELIDALCTTFKGEIIVDHEDFDGNTPLVLAVKQKELKSSKTLVSYGASITKRLRRSATVIHHATVVADNIAILGFLASSLSEKEIKDIVDEKEPGTPLHWACHSNCVHNISFCLDDLSIPINAIDFYGGSPLFVASALQNLEAMRFLLERGADLTVTANDGTTIVSHITETEKPDIACLRLLCHFDFDNFFAAYDHINLSDAALVTELTKKKLTLEEREANCTRFKAQGDSSFHAREYAKAIRFYTLAISFCPSNKALFSNRSACYFNIGSHRKALADALHCISLDEGWARGFYRAAASYYELDELKKGELMCDKGLSIDPSITGLREIQKDIKRRLNSS